MQTAGHMVLKVFNCVHNDKIRLIGVHNTKIESYGLERSQLSTQWKYQVIWS